MSVLLLIFALSAKCIPFRSPVAIHFAFALKNYVRQQWSAATSFLYIHIFFRFQFFHHLFSSLPFLFLAVACLFFLLAFWLISICKPKKMGMHCLLRSDVFCWRLNFRHFFRISDQKPSNIHCYVWVIDNYTAFLSSALFFFVIHV